MAIMELQKSVKGNESFVCSETFYIPLVKCCDSKGEWVQIIHVKIHWNKI